MPKLSSIVYYAFHPQQLRSMIQWKVWHDPVHQRNPEKEEPSLRECFQHLNNTSRSFSAVIQELHPELLVPVALFYLVLRGLDTIEDDMTIDIEKKDPLLRDFHNILEKDGWTFTENGPDEKDRDLLVHFDCVVTEFKKIKQPYRVIIKDITKKMGNGMADYVRNSKFNTYGVDSVKDYELYCHYVAGLVGEGLTRLFVESGLANPGLLSRPQLMESMGQFLQQVNIIRDIREDYEDKRRFWPREIWSKHVDEFEDMFKPENKEKAMACQSEMVLHALQRADECLFYLAGIREQSVFNFCAIPQSMAIATLELCFRNYQMFERNIKITKGDTCRLMIDSTQNLQIICGVFKAYARKIQKKNNPVDPNYLEIGIACGKIEQFVESVFPTTRPDSTKASALTVEDQKKKEESDAEAKKDAMYMMIAVIATLGVISTFMIGAAWLAGARFDLVFAQLKNGKFIPQTDDTVTHGEL